MKRLIGLILVVVVGAALWAFEPWRLVTSSEVHEPAPTSSPVATDPSQEDDVPGKKESGTPEPEGETPRDVVLPEAEFVDAEHGTSGTARILELADGRRFLRIEDLATSDGPDLHVWLSDARSGGEWGSYDDGHVVRLGELKATHGDQNYEIPAGADLEGIRSAVIWCDRFDVAFGTAPLALTSPEGIRAG